MASSKTPLGELLVEASLITREQLDQVLALQREDKRRLGKLLAEAGLVSETQITQILSQQLSVPWVSLYRVDFTRQLLDLVPRELAEKFCLVPIFVRRIRGMGQTLYVAMDDPSDEVAIHEVSEFAGLPVRAMIAPPSDIRAAIRAYYFGSGRFLLESPPPSSFQRRAMLMDAPSEAAIAQSAGPQPAEPAPAAADTLPPAAPLASGEAEQAGTTLPEPEAADDAYGTTLVEVQTISGSGPKHSAAVDTEPPDSGPEIEVREIELPTPKHGGGSRLVTITLLDGTTVRLPARPQVERPPSAPAPPVEEHLTARDLVLALRAMAHGADASEVIGENVRWEALFAALLSVLLKKHLIADWEFVEEYKNT
jgi:type IV pilus assembly protein PilB